MSLKQEDPDTAQLAWAEFFERHWSYLLRVCLKCYGQSVGDLGAEDLVKDTFIRAYERAATFTPAAGDLGLKRKRIRAWLGRIANRLFLSSWKSQSAATKCPIPNLVPLPPNIKPPR
jgi:DNA-directed RNA polymerase specialized sigma24 family protein